MLKHPYGIREQDAREEGESEPKRRSASLRSGKKQARFLETLIWEVREDQVINAAARAEGVVKLMKLYREVLADDLEEKLILAYEKLEQLKQMIERRPTVNH